MNQPERPRAPSRTSAAALAIGIALVLGSGVALAWVRVGGDEAPATEGIEEAGRSERAAGGACGEIQHPEDLGGAHLGEGERFTGYSSWPPASGPHDPVATQAGAIYGDPQPVEQVIHAMEHGAVVFWVGEEASEGIRRRLERVVTAAYEDGYHALIVTPVAGIEEPFAMTAWGSLQRCRGVDAADIRAFLDAHYGSGLEGHLACGGPAAALPPCGEAG